MFEDLLDRPWFVFDPWKTYVASLVERVRTARAKPRFSVPPMSDTWLRQHDLDYPKHGDDPSA